MIDPSTRSVTVMLNPIRLPIVVVILGFAAEKCSVKEVGGGVGVSDGAASFEFWSNSSFNEGNCGILLIGGEIGRSIRLLFSP